MAKPAFIRYLPARLKPLGKPMVWVPLTAFTLLGIFAWEYYRHPDWFSRDPITSLTPKSQLTPEEEARLSEIDTLDVLLSGSRAPEGTATVTSQINPNAPETSKNASDSNALEGTSGIDLSDYPIPGAALTTSTPTTLSPTGPSVFSAASRPTTRPANSTSSFNFGDGLANTASPTATRSALAEALSRREADLAAIEQPSSAGDPSLFGNRRSTRNSPTTAENLEALPDTNLVVPGSFIRTTPEMSPPAGTTGYQAPATSRLPAFNVIPQQPTRSPYSLSSDTSPFTVPTPSIGQAVPAPTPAPIPATTTVAAPVSGSQNPVVPSRLYTQPSSVQPDQGPVINPRR